MQKAFESFDVDKSGFLDPQELRAALTMLGVKPSIDALKEMGIQDRDGDGTLSLMDLDQDGDQKIDFEEFKCLAAILPKRDHAIYRGALSCDPIVIPKAAPGQEAKLTPVQRDRLEAQEKTKAALNEALARLRKKMRLNDDKMLLKDSVLLRKFNEVGSSHGNPLIALLYPCRVGPVETRAHAHPAPPIAHLPVHRVRACVPFSFCLAHSQLDNTGDARVDQKELEAYLRRETPDLTKRDAWIIMNCADANNDKVMTFDEFSACLPAPLHSACLACKLRVHGVAHVPLRSLSFVRDLLFASRRRKNDADRGEGRNVDVSCGASHCGENMRRRGERGRAIEDPSYDVTSL